MKPQKVLMISADQFEDSELLEPRKQIQEAGFEVDLAAPEAGEIKGKKGGTATANLSVAQVDSIAPYAMLVLPGGKAPGELRKIPRVLDIAREFDTAGIPIAAICHGPQILISAGIMQGRKATAYESVQPELAEAGAQAVDQEVVVDGNLVTSRNPNDIPAFNREIVKKLV